MNKLTLITASVLTLAACVGNVQQKQTNVAELSPTPAQ